MHTTVNFSCLISQLLVQPKSQLFERLCLQEDDNEPCPDLVSGSSDDEDNWDEEYDDFSIARLPTNSSDVVVSRRRARFVIRGFGHYEDVDYAVIFAPVVSYIKIRLFLAIWVANKKTKK